MAGARQPQPANGGWLKSAASAARKLLLLGSVPLFAARAADFSEIEPLLQQHCVECHASKDSEGGLALDSFDALLKGGESGPAIVSGKGSESLLVKALEGNWGKTGKNQFMPPGKRDKLTPAQIALFKSWVDGGAKPPAQPLKATELVVPKIAVKGAPRTPVSAIAYAAGPKLVAVARPTTVELVDATSRGTVRTLSGFRGRVTDAAFSSDGKFLFTAAGETGVGGEVRQWNVADGSVVKIITGHRDAIQTLAVTADGRTLATGGYDYSIHLWDLAATGDLKAPTRSIAASQGAIMGLAFRPDGRVLASVSYDRTTKIYDPATGNRLETFGQALKELNAIAFSPDGKTLLSGGNDNRIRSYAIGEEGKEGQNQLLATVFAHEGAILRLAYSPDGKSVASSADDKTVKLFDATDLKQRRQLEVQPDWPTALAFAGNETLVVGRADGSLGWYGVAEGKPQPPPKPELTLVEPRGIERGKNHRVRLMGNHLNTATVVAVYRGRMLAAMAPQRDDAGFFIELNPASDESRGAWEISVTTPGGETARAKLWIDDLPQAVSSDRLATLPVSVWGALEKPGDKAVFSFQATAGQTLVFDLAGRSISSKGAFSLELLDRTGKTIARDENATQSTDPWIAHTFTESGDYQVRVSEVQYGGSKEHFFRLSVGQLPFVTGIAPLVVPVGTESPVRLLGFNLPDEGRVTVKPSNEGDIALPGTAATYRNRRGWNWIAASGPVVSEGGSNTAVPVPGSANASFSKPGEMDSFRFTAQRGVNYVIETTASRRGSPADTRIEILTLDGKPVQRVRLQAVRNSAITFRPETSDDAGIRFDSWEEMELNDLLWCSGEVMKLFRAPQGPDSDTVLYTSNGRRRGWFDTSPVAHPLEEAAYIVRPLAADETPQPNGLPAFTVNYENDDDALRQLGSDSRISFTAPADGDYVVRVSESRGFGGPAYQYRLQIRESRPAFTVSLNGAPGSVAAGSGQSFSVSANRTDGFEGEIRIDFDHLPEGWTINSPLVIEAGHSEATGNLQLRTNAPAAKLSDWDAVTVVASGRVEGRFVAMAVNTPGKPTPRTEAPKLLVRLDPVEGTSREVVIAPGGTARAKLSIVRNGFDGVVTFSVDNLPHGVIVENLGLNGITFLGDENEREIFLSCVRWVADLERPFHAVENQAGRQTSPSLMLKVRRGAMAGR